jgi:hypothetical protein
MLNREWHNTQTSSPEEEDQQFPVSIKDTQKYIIHMPNKEHELA